MIDTPKLSLVKQGYFPDYVQHLIEQLLFDSLLTKCKNCIKEADFSLLGNCI